MLKSLQGKRGFTLIELIIVVVILGILILIVIAATRGNTEKADDASIKAAAGRIQVALEDCYDSDANTYPAALTGNACIEGKFDNGDVPDDNITITGLGTGAYELTADLTRENDLVLRSKQ